MQQKPLNIDLAQLRETDKSFGRLSRLILGIPLVFFLIFISILAYLGIFLIPVEVQGISVQWARSVVSIGLWSISAFVWDGMSNLTNIKFGTTFQLGILMIVLAMITTYQKTGAVSLNIGSGLVFLLLLLIMAFCDNFSRLMNSDDEKLSKEKRKNIYSAEAAARHRLEDPAGTIPADDELDLIRRHISR